ncbi:MAG: hypothetical protein ACYS5V_03805, partial [Planctomycetota bacterium]
NPAELQKRFVALVSDNGYFVSPEYATNPFTGQEIRYERSPGNFSTRQVEGGTYFCLYDIDVKESRVMMGPAGGDDP